MGRTTGDLLVVRGKKHKKDREKSLEHHLEKVLEQLNELTTE